MIQHPWYQTFFLQIFKALIEELSKSGIHFGMYQQPKKGCTLYLFVPGGDYKTTRACPAWTVWKCLAREQSDLSFQTWLINQSRTIALPLLIGIGKSTFLALSLSRWLNWKKAVWHLVACFCSTFPLLLRNLHICVSQLSLRKCAAVQGSHYEF